VEEKDEGELERRLRNSKYLLCIIIIVITVDIYVLGITFGTAGKLLACCAQELQNTDAV
jgi:hypothetical protein